VSDETIGQLHDSIEPGGHTTRRAFGRTWMITRLAVPPPAIEDVCAEPSCDRPNEDPWGYCEIHWARREAQR
jgi:hypothetical protein